MGGSAGFPTSPPSARSQGARRQAAVGAGESFQRAACSLGLPTHSPSPLSLTCHQGDGGKMSARPLCLFDFAPSGPWESTQQCPPSRNFPDPSAGPSSPPASGESSYRKTDHLTLPTSLSASRLPLLRGSCTGAPCSLVLSSRIFLPWYGRTQRARPGHAQTPFSLAIHAGGEGG